MGKVLRVLSGGLFGGGSKNTDDRPKVKEDDKRSELNRSVVDQKDKKRRAAGRRARVAAQTQLGAAPGGRAGLRTSLNKQPGRSGIGIT